MIKIQFTKHYQKYLMNKTYSFNAETATALVDLGVAEFYHEKSEKIQYENKMNDLSYAENKGL